MTVKGLFRAIQPYGAWLGEAFGRLLYPPHCLICERPTREDEDRYLCRDCIYKISFVNEPTCRKCGHELGPYVDAGQRCANCRNQPLRFDRAVAAAHHDGPARDLVLSLKFAAHTYNAYPLSKLLAARLEETGISEQADLIVPVPLHRKRFRSRGFNQSEILARELSDRIGVRVAVDNLRRIIDTPPQTQTLSLASRRANVKGAFDVRKPKAFAGKCVLVVDDVLTTGATTSECAGALKRAGARKVYVATATRRMMTPPGERDHDADAARYEIESAPPAPGDNAQKLSRDRGAGRHSCLPPHPAAT